MVCFLDLGTSKVSGLLIDDLSNSKINAFSSIETSGVKKGSIIEFILPILIPCLFGAFLGYVLGNYKMIINY